MKHSGRARRAGFKLIITSLIGVLAILALGIFATLFGTALVAAIPIFLGLWMLFALFTLYFFRDPTPVVPPGPNLVVAPAYGKVDVIETMTEPVFMAGECQRISMFLSVADVHVQYAPAGGKVTLVKYTQGEFVNAIRTESALHNENVLIGFEANEPRGVKIGLRLIAGVVTRRIVPYVQEGDEVARGERVSLIQFGSRADVYLPTNARIKIKVGDKLAAGASVIATFDEVPT